MGAFRKHLPAIFCCLVSTLLLTGALWLQTQQNLPGYQYIVSTSENIAELYRDAVNTLTKEDISDAVIYGRLQHTAIQTAYGNENVTVYAIDERWKELHFEALSEGRFVTQRDVSKGSQCIMISESLARKCIPSGNAIGKTITLGGSDFEVIGIIRDKLLLGEVDDFVVYIPITAVSVDEGTLTISIPKAAAEKKPASVWAAIFQNWSSNGSFHHIAQELFTAWAFCYVLLLWLMFIIMTRASSGWKRMVGHSVRDIQARLEMSEWAKVWLHIFSRILLLMMTGTFVVIGWWLFLKVLVYPLQLFPEYVPSEPARLSSWIACVHLMLCGLSTGTVYCSVENSLLRISGGMITAAGFLVMTMMKRRANP